MNVLELDGVTKVYGEQPPVAALAGVSFAVQPGELVAIVGPSGSGKSTLLHVMGTLEPPTTGAVRINGVDVVPFVEAELDRRFPGRAERRAPDPEGLRNAWAAPSLPGRLNETYRPTPSFRNRCRSLWKATVSPPCESTR